MNVEYAKEEKIKTSKILVPELPQGKKTWDTTSFHVTNKGILAPRDH